MDKKNIWLYGFIGFQTALILMLGVFVYKLRTDFLESERKRNTDVTIQLELLHRLENRLTELYPVVVRSANMMVHANSKIDQVNKTTEQIENNQLFKRNR